MVILPKIFKSGDAYLCACKALWTTRASDSFEFLLDQTLICVTVPEVYQVDNHVLTPIPGEEDIILPVTWVEIRHEWTTPQFRDMSNLQSLRASDDIEKLQREWEGR
jgi:hypothetical protein